MTCSAVLVWLEAWAHPLPLQFLPYPMKLPRAYARLIHATVMHCSDQVMAIHVGQWDCHTVHVYG